MKKIIILNAPPKSGKDVAAEYMQQNFNFEHVEFKEKLFELVKVIYSISDSEWEYLYDRSRKEVPQERLNGLSPRESLIDISENVIKLHYGADYFGKALSSKINKSKNDTFIVSDGGFISEIEPLINIFGPENIMVVRIQRDECTFDGDSRKYLPNISGIVTIDLDNNSSLEYFFKCIEAASLEFIRNNSSIQ